MCNLPFYHASTCTLSVDPLQARPTKCCGRRSRYGKICSFYMYSRIPSCLYYLLLIPGTSLWASTSCTSLQQRYIHDIVHRAFYLQHFRYYCYCKSCCCYCSHIHSSLQCCPWSQDRLQKPYSSSSVQYARNIMRLFWDETRAHGAQIRYVPRAYVSLFEEEIVCATGRWAFGCSDTVMVNI